MNTQTATQPPSVRPLLLGAVSDLDTATRQLRAMCEAVRTDSNARRSTER